MKEQLDETNLQILRLLQADGSITNADLSRKIGLKPPSVLQRVRRLEQLNLIKGYTAHLNAEELGFGLTIFAQVSLALHQDQPIENFVKSVSEINEVMEVHHVSGEFDFLLRIVVQNMRHYEQLIRDQLSTIKGMGKLQSCFVLASPKESYALPI